MNCTVDLDTRRQPPSSSPAFVAGSCRRQDLNLRSRLRRPGYLLHCGVSGVRPGLSPDHLCLQWLRCRVVESTIDSTSHLATRTLSRTWPPRRPSWTSAHRVQHGPPTRRRVEDYASQMWGFKSEEGLAQPHDLSCGTPADGDRGLSVDGESLDQRVDLPCFPVGDLLVRAGFSAESG
jgi:hypothetical protein